MTTAGYGATGPGQGPGDGSGGSWAAPARPAEPPVGELPAAATPSGVATSPDASVGSRTVVEK
ncbi:hypothetical protein QLR68_08360 [Micromonospora sp. DH15]|nr:hypothetical protein [Micromonospora sp. DH15]